MGLIYLKIHFSDMIGIYQPTRHISYKFNQMPYEKQFGSYFGKHHNSNSSSNIFPPISWLVQKKRFRFTMQHLTNATKSKHNWNQE